MDLTHTSSITYDFVAIPEADITFQFRLKGHKDRIKVSINMNIYYTDPFRIGRISVANPGIQTVYTEREDTIHMIKMKIPQFKNCIRSCIVLSMETASSEKKVIVEDLNITDISSSIQTIQTIQTDVPPHASSHIQTLYSPQIQQEKTQIQQEKIKKKFMDDNYKFNVICEGLMFQNSGFAKVMRNVTFGLDKIGCRVKAISHDDVNSDILNTEKGRRINELRSNSIENPCIWITMTHPAGVQPHNSNYSIGYVMFETLEFPDNFAQNLKMQNEIWTPSNICKDSMKRSGLDNVYVMPLGVDTELFDPDNVGHPTHIRGNLSDMNGKYTFLSVMSYSERKSPTLLVRSFAEEFRGQDDVGLYLKGAWYDAQKAQNEINEEIKDISNPPLISLDFNIYSDDILASLYKACDCFVLPTKGEGWGLPIIEAMSMSKPVITTRWGGHLEFANNNNSYLINVEKFAPEPRCDWITPEYVGRNFAIPDKDHLRALMRHVYEHREEAKEKGIIARKHIVNNYSWEKCCGRIYNRLEEISNIK